MPRAVSMLAGAVVVLVAFASPIGPAYGTVTAGSSTPRVVLVTAGKAPRSPLRLAVTAGTRTQATVELTESIKQSIGGQNNSADVPPIHLGMQTTIGSVAPNGNAQVSYRYSDVGLVDDGTLTAAQRDQIQTALAPLDKVTGTATITSRNEYLDSQIAGTEGLDPSVAQLTNQLAGQLGQLAVPFPREAVGVGARWRAASSGRLSGIDARQAYQYTVRDRRANEIDLDIEYTQTAPRQRAELPGAPAGTDVRITKYRASGRGSTTLNLSEPLPLASEVHATSQQEFRIKAQGQSGALKQSVVIDLKLSRQGTGG